MRTAVVALLVLASILCLGSTPAICAEKTITDMEGRTVTISEPPERVITAGYIMPTAVMAALGVGDKIVGTGMQWTGSWPTNVSTATVAIPGFEALPDLGRGTRLNIEAAAALNPDVVILEKDGGGQGDQLESYADLIEKFSLFNESFSLVVINNAACFDKPSPDSIYEEITIIGEIFDKQERASEIIDLLKEEVALVADRTKDIKPEDRTSVLFMGMVAGIPAAQGKLAQIFPDYDCSTLYPEITKIKNVHTGNTRELMSSEQLITLDPDVILLSMGSDDKVETLYNNSSDYKVLHGMRAIKEKKVYSMGRFEGARTFAGLEFPIEMLLEAKAAYPDRFKDINVGEQLTEHYKALYGLDDEQVETLKEAMSLDWMDEEGF